ncbi:MAG: hypothetical protein Fur0035_09120 [Anaerolineales bacterium]
MSRDRITLTRAEALRRRREEEQNRRENRAPRRVSTPRPVAAPGSSSRARSGNSSPLKLVPASTSRLRRQYNSAAFSRPYSAPRPGILLPEIQLPRLSYGPRWISFFLLAACLGVLYSLLNLDPFIVRGVTISGNQRISSAEIEGVLGVINQPALLLNPAQVEYNVLATFPEISGVQIQINPPAEVMLSVQERVPVIAWSQDGQTVWVDAAGYAFPPRGESAGLFTVSAAGAPPTPANFDPLQSIGARAFLPGELAQAVAAMTPALPEGAALIYDPRYGLGWYDARGWQVYFGHAYGNMALKLGVYQSMVEYLARNQIEPALISVEYPSAPYYRLKE